MTRLDTLTAAIAATAACLLAAAAFLAFLATRGTPLGLVASLVLAGVVALFVPAAAAYVTRRVSAWRGVGPWCVCFAIAAVAVAVVFALLGL